MPFTRSSTALFIAMSAMSAGCLDTSNNFDTGLGTGGSDTGLVPDAGVTDIGSPDLGLPDLGPDTGPDLGEPDLGPPDLGPPDLGPQQCPSDPNAMCTNAEACGPEIPAPTNCDNCVPSNNSLCVNASCNTPPTLEAADLYAIVIQILPSVPNVESFGGFAIAAETAGDRVLSCADVYAGEVDFADRCYNVLDSRTLGVGQGGDTFTISFGGFASGQKTLFVIYGFTQNQTRGERVGVSCTEVDVGPPLGGQPTFIGGEPMELL